ncbi:hypothetical protein PG993_004282 [Apiospora rasikravindrae]|uniref:Uncharacterized protein n=1 Tax=Apiospora rasikravindrae TaxID=990691 RepID=A0ABR1TCD1_9PEZI
MRPLRGQSGGLFALSSCPINKFKFSAWGPVIRHWEVGGAAESCTGSPDGAIRTPARPSPFDFFELNLDLSLFEFAI